jgi:hypothetical protein
MAYKQSTMQPITVQLQESKALASICSMSNRFYEVWWDVEHLLKVVSEILGALVIVLLHSPSSACPSSNGPAPIIAILDATTSIQRQAKEQLDL